MKKNLLLPLIALALFACGEVTPTTEQIPQGPQTITIDKEDRVALEAVVEEGKTYPTSGTITPFTTDGTNWTYNDLCGLPNPTYNAEYAARGVTQLKTKGAGIIANTEALVAGYKTATIKFYQTYETVQTDRLPLIKEGTSSEALENATLNEEGPVAGVAQGWIGNVSGENQFEAYEYTITYSLKDTSTYFAITTGQNAAYVLSVVFTA